AADRRPHRRRRQRVLPGQPVGLDRPGDLELHARAALARARQRLDHRTSLARARDRRAARHPARPLHADRAGSGGLHAGHVVQARLPQARGRGGAVEPMVMTNKEVVQTFFASLWTDPGLARSLATDDVTWITTRSMPIPGNESTIFHVGW